MASDYGLNFGFRRSDESMLSGREGRQRVPATGTYKQGDLVTLDPANPGFIKVAPADSPIDPGFTGLLIQEDVWDIPLNGNQVLETYDYDVIRNSHLCAIWTGGGAKVWFRNTVNQTLPGQRAKTGITKVDLTGIVIGSLIRWDGTKYAATTDATKAIGRVTLTNGVDLVEVVLAR